MIVRQMDLDDLARTLDWAAEEGWNPGLDDAGAFLAADPAGFFLAEVDGQPAAAISVVNHSHAFAFLGLYLCRPAYRGQGLGYALWKVALTHAGTRTVGLDGVPAQQANYARSGFVLAGSVERLEGPSTALPDPDVRPIIPVDLAALAELDAAANGYARPRFLTAWLTDTPTRRTLVLTGPDGPTGFVTVRTCRRNAKIGPVVAPDAAAADRLIRAAAAEMAVDRVIVDVPVSNGALQAILRGRGFTSSFGTARMYRGSPPNGGTSLQAVGTLELG